MKINKQSSVLPEWLKAFANVVKDKKISKADMQVGNLPTVNWNDNTFYVDVVDDTVTLYNQYGNEVRKIQVNELGKTDDEDVVSAVDRYLNEHHVVASIAEDDVDVDLDGDSIGETEDEMDMVFEQELEKVASAEDGMPEGENTDAPAEGTESAPTEGGEQTATASVEESVEEENSAEEVEEPVAESELVEPSVEPASEEPTLDTDPVVSEGIENEAGVMSQGVEDESGAVSEGIEDVATESAPVAPVVEEPVEETDEFTFDGVDEEPVTVQEACDCEECEDCDEEKNFVSLASYNRLVARLNALEKTVKAFQAEQRAYTEVPNDAYDLNCQEEEVKNFNESAEMTQKVIDAEHELDMSKMSDRAKLNENFVNEVINNNAEQTEAVNEVVAPAEVPSENTEEITEEPVVEEEVVETEEPAVEEIAVEEPVETTEEVAPTEEAPVEDEVADDDFVALDEKQFEEFDAKKCPFCHKESLTPVDEVNGIIGVRCDECGKEFAVGDEVYTKK